MNELIFEFDDRTLLFKADLSLFDFCDFRTKISNFNIDTEFKKNSETCHLQKNFLKFIDRLEKLIEFFLNSPENNILGKILVVALEVIKCEKLYLLVSYFYFEDKKYFNSKLLAILIRIRRILDFLKELAEFEGNSIKKELSNIFQMLGNRLAFYKGFYEINEEIKLILGQQISEQSSKNNFNEEKLLQNILKENHIRREKDQSMKTSKNIRISSLFASYFKHEEDFHVLNELRSFSKAKFLNKCTLEETFNKEILDQYPNLTEKVNANMTDNFFEIDKIVEQLGKSERKPTNENERSSSKKQTIELTSFSEKTTMDNSQAMKSSAMLKSCEDKNNSKTPIERKSIFKYFMTGSDKKKKGMKNVNSRATITNKMNVCLKDIIKIDSNTEFKEDLSYIYIEEQIPTDILTENDLDFMNPNENNCNSKKIFNESIFQFLNQMKQSALKFNAENTYNSKNNNYFLNSFKREKIFQNLKFDSFDKIRQYPLKRKINLCAPQFFLEEEF